ncbi:hypothetical protein KI387_025195, partial [Taxus chinensis]
TTMEDYVDNPHTLKTVEIKGELSVHATETAYDFHGNVADKKKTGRWKASPFIIWGERLFPTSKLNEVAERLAYYAIAVNMFSYVVLEMHESITHAATFVTDWIGAAFVLTLFGAFVADAYWGRFKTILSFSCIYLVGMAMLLINASVSSLRPPKCTVVCQPVPNSQPKCNAICEPASDSQLGFLYIALYIIALGTGGIKPCVSSFGADQFDETDEKERKGKYSFFNWFFFGINTGALLGITVLVYIQDNYGWVWGFGIPTAAMFVSVIVFVCGAPFYRFKYPTGSPFTRFAQVLVASCRKWRTKVDDNRNLYEMEGSSSAIKGFQKLAHTQQYSVDIHHCPLYLLRTARYILRSPGQNIKKRPVLQFDIPPASLPLFTTLNAILLVPFYDILVVPMLRKFTGIDCGISSLQRIGIGLFVSIFAMISAAVIENKRLEKAEDFGALDMPRATLPMSVFWLVPQYFLMGTAEIFTYVGQMEFFYDEATDGTRSLSSALFLSEIGIGSWLSSMIVKVIESSTGGREKGWLRNNLNRSRLDLFFWVLAGINLVNFFIFLAVAKFYRYTKISPTAGTVEEEDATVLR